MAANDVFGCGNAHGRRHGIRIERRIEDDKSAMNAALCAAAIETDAME